MSLQISNEVTTVCYGKVREWDNRSEAKRYFLDAMLNAEGAERERYSNIYLKLQLGYSDTNHHLNYGEEIAAKALI